MPPKPRLTACVAHHAFDRSVGGPLDLIATLANESDLDREATIAAEKHELHLHADIHACACAVLIVSDRAGVDADTRLAALHARREGAHRFILLVAEYPDAGRPDAVERDARALLESLGVDGNDAPAVRAPLREATNALVWAPEGTAALVAALDDLPAFLEPAPLLTTPPSFAPEAALLDAIRPLLAPATRIHQRRVDLAETALHGGSHHGGVPYLERDEPWPQCPRCRRPMPALLQVDRRDLLHDPPPSHGLFVVYACPDCNTDEVRHHADPQAARRRTAPPEATPRGRSTLLRPARPCRMLPDRALLRTEHPDVAAHLCALTGSDDPLPVFDRLADAMGLDHLQHTPHFGGHHATVDHPHNHRFTLPTPRCDVCDAPCAHVVQISIGADHRSLWACRDHPSSSFHRVHP